MNTYLVGHITNTHGIRGEVKIYNYSDFNRFFVGAALYVEFLGVKQELIIEKVRQQNHLFIVKFKGFDNINDILKFKGLDLYTNQDPTDELREDDYHYHDLIGKACYTSEGSYIGLVQSVVDVPQGHLLEVMKSDQKKVLIPFIKAFVKDVLDDKIIITPIEGLL
ncbi:MAG: ribosome maturation factor RimM [Acholeplasmataceae bacterium]|jgi:16S rRNA processing protein RimM|nr:ribosome maturation factor RimM [Acholeplasmataceae bacterium]